MCNFVHLWFIYFFLHISFCVSAEFSFENLPFLLPFPASFIFSPARSIIQDCARAPGTDLSALLAATATCSFQHRHAETCLLVVEHKSLSKTVSPAIPQGCPVHSGFSTWEENVFSVYFLSWQRLIVFLSKAFYQQPFFFPPESSLWCFNLKCMKTSLSCQPLWHKFTLKKKLFDLKKKKKIVFWEVNWRWFCQNEHTQKTLCFNFWSSYCIDRWYYIVD